MKEQLSTVELLRKKKKELLARVADIDDDISTLTAMAPEGKGPVIAEKFLEESGEFDWIFGGLIAEGTVTMIVAEPRLGKTTLMVQLSLGLSVGREVLGFSVAKPRRVLYILAEGSRHAFRNRFRATCGSMGIPPSSLDWWLQPPTMSEFKLSSTEVDRVIRASQAEFIVLDTLGYFGGGDENDASSWKSNVMAPLRAYAQELNTAFVLVHHPKKSSQNDTSSRWERGRGTSAMFGDVDHYLTLEKVPLEPHEKQLGAEARGRLEQRRVLHVDKNKYGLDDVSFQLEFLKSRGTFELGAW